MVTINDVGPRDGLQNHRLNSLNESTLDLTLTYQAGGFAQGCKMHRLGAEWTKWLENQIYKPKARSHLWYFQLRPKPRHW